MMTALPCLNQLLQGVVLTELSFTHIVTFIQNKPQTIPDKWKKVKIQSHIFSSNFQGLTLIPPQMQYTNNANKCRQKISFEHQKICVLHLSWFCINSAMPDPEDTPNAILHLHRIWHTLVLHDMNLSIETDTPNATTDLSSWPIHTGCTVVVCGWPQLGSGYTHHCLRHHSCAASGSGSAALE